MRAVIDTNVFVSGIFWRGQPHQILVAWQAGRFKLVLSSSILEEYRRVLGELAAKYPGVQYERLRAISVELLRGTFERCGGETLRSFPR